MATIQQVKNGLVKYIDNDMLPHLSGFKKIGLGIYTALAAENVANIVMKYKDHPAISVLGIIDGSNVDVDKLYNAVYPMFNNGQKQIIDIPVIGEYVVDSTDIEKLYKYIKES